ncbi:AraC family transcriptional regulator [Zunongwangia sp.]|uniref:AraC family transcriptional regulator n=1 Tax=Zunongwangia sp. TaxID=1965325 RepID=UPI003AA96BEB
MGIEQLHKPVDIIYEKVDECPIENRRFNFFQIVYVISGNGNYTLNTKTKAYEKENLFLLTPEDMHTFHVENTTEFLLIRFNYIYLKDYKWKYIDHLKCALNNAGIVNENILHLSEDKKLVKHIVYSILDGIKKQDIFSHELTSHLINSLLIIITRNLLHYVGQSAEKDQRHIQIIHYIQEHIYTPENLSARAMAGHFNISTNYLSRYFKANAGIGLQDYISKYKIHLIENRLKFSNMRVKEIPEEFSFTDGSHLNKFFKNCKGISISDYRKKEKASNY